MECNFNYPTIQLVGDSSEDVILGTIDYYLLVSIKVTENVDVDTIGPILAEEFSLEEGDFVALTGQEVTEENAAYVLGEDLNLVYNQSINNTYIDEGATASDTLDGNLTRDIVEENNIDFSEIGIYYVTYSVTNSHDLTSSIKRRIKVVKENSSLLAIGNVNIADYSISSTYDIPIQNNKF